MKRSTDRHPTLLDQAIETLDQHLDDRSRFNAPQHLFERLKTAVEPHGLAFVAVARKLTINLNAMLHDRSRRNPRLAGCNQSLGETWRLPRSGALTIMSCSKQPMTACPKKTTSKCRGS